MNVAGKKLQDIYNAGSSKLDELKRTQQSALATTVDEHLVAVDTAEKRAVEQVQQRSKELEADIKAFLASSVQRMQRVIDSETQETDSHLRVLTNSLDALGKRLRETIADLKQSHDAQIALVTEDVTDLCEREYDSAAAAIEREDYNASKNLKIQDTFVINSFQQKLDHSLVEVRGEEKQINNKLFRSYLQNTHSIDTQISGLGDQLSGQATGHSEALAEKFKSGESRLQSELDVLLNQAENYNQETDEKVRESFERISAMFRAESEQCLAELVSELRSLHASSIKEFSSDTEELAKGLESAATSAHELLKTTGEEIHKKVDSALSEFTAECNRRQDSRFTLRKELEARSQEILQKIKKDLLEIQSGFENKLRAITTSASEQLSSLCSAAETAIVAAQKDCESQLDSMVASTKDQIHSGLMELIRLAKGRQEVALEEVLKAGGSTPADPDQSTFQAPSNKRSRRARSKVQETEEPGQKENAALSEGDQTNDRSAEKAAEEGGD